MSLVDHDSWDIEYEGCERLRRQILEQLHERQQRASQPSSSEYVKLTNSLETGVQQLRKDLGHLKWVLDNAVTWETCPAQELQRRRIDYDRLASQLREIETKFTNSTRSNQLASSSASAWQSSGAAAAAPRQPQDAAALKLRAAEIMEDQNRGLDVLSATLSRQHALARQLGNEVEDQNNILDNLANNMDRVEAGVQRETNTIGQVSRRDSTWGYWLVIICLFVAIIVVVIL